MTRRAAFALAVAIALVQLASSGLGARASEPDDPDAPVAGIGYEPIVNDYEPIGIVTKPVDWRAANDLVEQLDGPRGQLMPQGAFPQRKKAP